MRTVGVIMEIIDSIFCHGEEPIRLELSTKDEIRHKATNLMQPVFFNLDLLEDRGDLPEGALTQIKGIYKEMLKLREVILKL